MKPMRPFLVTLVLVWTAASIGAYFYSQQQNISRALLFALLPAFLLEAGLYLMPGFEAVRRAFERLGPEWLKGALLTAGAVTPYLLESWRTGTFGLLHFVILLALTATAAFWYVALRPGPLVDLLFLVFMAGVFLSSAFKQIYVRPTPHLQLEVLGKLMWIRLGLMELLCVRRIQNVRFGFVPNRKEWRIGVEQFLLFLPAGAILAYLLRFARFHPMPVVWWKFILFVPAMFCGILWVLALGEEFFFRGFLQPLLSRGLRSQTAGLIATSAIFGGAHLTFHAFPNWRFAILAGVAGLFYGVAYLRTRSIRASMVTHALVVTTWRTLFAG